MALHVTPLTGAGFEVLQLLPHAPQLVAVVRSVSQPSACLLLLQSPQFASHVPPHVLFVQVRVMWFDEQTKLALSEWQPPQSLTEVVVLVSQPSAAPL